MRSESEMTRDDIIRMAEQAGFSVRHIAEPPTPYYHVSGHGDVLQRFAALVAAAERERIAEWVEDMCAGLDAKTIANGIRNGGNDDIRAFEVRK